MAIYSEAEVINLLEELIERAAKGEQFLIARHGRPVVELTALIEKSPTPDKMDSISVEQNSSQK